MEPFKVVYLAGLVIGSMIRVIYTRGLRRKKGAPTRRESLLVFLFMITWGISQILALVYCVTDRLSFADYSLPIWLQGIGAGLYVVSIVLLWRSHADLGRNWSATLHIKQDHSLIISGVYKHIRHPMYTAHLVWSLAQALLLANWLAGPVALAAILGFIALRIPREEQLMLEQFGDAYREYTRRTGRLFPRFVH
ncbi:MAG: isoprenylcysteine carboxylmethyltransferase family protein [Sedimentisphaerales bacterium]|nr:isoprenylcysteine carboxylmethyltransferase family protein [Sedimentisphaerales bacterium]